MLNFGKMRTGKYVAQGSHGSVSPTVKDAEFITLPDGRRVMQVPVDEAMESWVKGSFTKITLQVKTTEELLAIHEKAKAEGLVTSLIIDAGRTEFKGVPTATCCSIGPVFPSKVQHITGDLALF